MAKMKDAVNTILQEQDETPGYEFTSALKNTDVDIEDHEDWLQQQAMMQAVWFPDMSYVEVDAYNTILWNCSIDARSWGIKDLHPTIHDISLNITLTIPGENGSDDAEFHIHSDSTKADGWSYEAEMEEGETKIPLFPKNMTVSLKSKNITVYY